VSSSGSATPPTRQTYSVREAAKLLGVSYTYVYERIAANDPLPFRVIRIGIRILIPRADIDALVAPRD
jgi:excisionase family DNA binding protein